MVSLVKRRVALYRIRICLSLFNINDMIDPWFRLIVSFLLFKVGGDFIILDLLILDFRWNSDHSNWLLLRSNYSPCILITKRVISKTINQSLLSRMLNNRHFILVMILIFIILFRFIRTFIFIIVNNISIVNFVLAIWALSTSIVLMVRCNECLSTF
jgi:hypothetical protein